jgi:hypothetical protein
MAPLTSEQQSRLLRDISRWGEVPVKQALQWIRDFHRVVGTLVEEGPASPHVPIFWIQLHGVVTELLDDLNEKVLLGEEAVAEGYTDGKYLKAITRTRAACLNVRNALAEDEWIYADYRRQCEVHIWQRGLRLQARQAKGGNIVGLKEKYRVDALSKELTKDEIDESVVRVLRHYQGNEPAIAVTFARKLLKPALALMIAAQASHAT